MKLCRSWMVVALAAACWTASCGSDSDDRDGSSAGGASGTGGAPDGSAGTGASAAVGGTGGSGASGGSAGGSAGDAGDAGACAPVALPSGWQPPTYKPAKAQPGSCTSAMIDEYVAKCAVLGAQPNEPPCGAFGASTDTAKAVCEACLWSNENDATWSALVKWAKGGGLFNPFGCFDLIDGATECAAKAFSYNMCLFEACGACMGPPTSDGGPDDAYTACAQAAWNGVCKTWQMPGKCSPIFQASQCVKSGSALATLTLSAFCGPAASDAGLDAASDASSDAPAESGGDAPSDASGG